MKKILMGLLILLLLSPAAIAKKIGDVNVANTISLNGQKLILNGAGERIKKFAFFKIHIYAGGLYLQSRNSNAQAIMDADAPMAIRMYMTTRLATASKLIDGWNEGFERVTMGKTAPFKKEIAEFNSRFKKNPNDGDMYEIAYIPGKGITVAMNGKLQGAPIPGLEFKKVVFGIWLTNNIKDEYLNKLKMEMLGK